MLKCAPQGQYRRRKLFFCLLVSYRTLASFFFALTAGKAFHCAFEAQITRRDSFRTAKHGYEQWRQTAQ